MARGILMLTIHAVSILCGLLTLAAVAPALAMAAAASSGGSDGPQLAHTVYFKLKDRSAGARAKLVAACQLYLTDHQGTVSFATGTVADEYQRPVNERDWDVSLHLVFVNKAAHDQYQDHPRHQKFIEESRENWEKVRVYDAYLAPAPAGD
jgi:hypothetical protein